jgi:hypothetical protein
MNAIYLNQYGNNEVYFGNVDFFCRDQFNQVFQNVTEPTVLVFRYNVPLEQQIYINPLPNVSLVDPDLPDNGSVINIMSKKAGRLIVLSEVVPRVQNYT